MGHNIWGSRDNTPKDSARLPPCSGTAQLYPVINITSDSDDGSSVATQDYLPPDSPPSDVLSSPSFQPPSFECSPRPYPSLTVSGEPPGYLKTTADPVSHPAPTPNVFIDRLPPGFKARDLFNLTNVFGEILCLRMFPAGYGFILFQTFDSAHQCIDTLSRKTDYHLSFSKNGFDVSPTPHNKWNPSMFVAKREANVADRGTLLHLLAKEMKTIIYAPSEHSTFTIAKAALLNKQGQRILAPDSQSLIATNLRNRNRIPLAPARHQGAPNTPHGNFGHNSPPVNLANHTVANAELFQLLNRRILSHNSQLFPKANIRNHNPIPPYPATHRGTFNTPHGDFGHNSPPVNLANQTVANAELFKPLDRRVLSHNSQPFPNANIRNPNPIPPYPAAHRGTFNTPHGNFGHNPPPVTHTYNVNKGTLNVPKVAPGHTAYKPAIAQDVYRNARTTGSALWRSR